MYVLLTVMQSAHAEPCARTFARCDQQQKNKNTQNAHLRKLLKLLALRFVPIDPDNNSAIGEIDCEKLVFQKVNFLDCGTDVS